MSCMTTTTTHIIVVKLSHKVVISLMRWLFCEATNTFSLPHHQKSYVTLHETTYETTDVYQYISFAASKIVLTVFSVRRKATCNVLS
jgi:hypothetical protein